MSLYAISPEAVASQKLALVRQEVETRVFRMALDAEAAQALQLVQMMERSAGLGTVLDTRA